MAKLTAVKYLKLSMLIGLPNPYKKIMKCNNMCG
jgi:hypothetical protein